MTEVTRNKTTLRKAAKLLQKAHDSIEVKGFNIQTYNPASSNIYGPTGACCYIGNIRLAANLNGSPGYDAGAGDGPELIIALKEMDRIAKRRLRDTSKDAFQEVRDQYSTQSDTGRFVEALGFVIREKYEHLDLSKEERNERERDYALKLLREALSDIYKEVENA